MKHGRIESVDDEWGIGNSLIVTLKPGWRFEDMGEQLRGYDTKKEAMQEVRSAKPCTCEECSKAAG